MTSAEMSSEMMRLAHKAGYSQCQCEAARLLFAAGQPKLACAVLDIVYSQLPDAAEQEVAK